MADYYLDINGLSKHLNAPVELRAFTEDEIQAEKYNERNLGFGVTRETQDGSLIKMLTAGGYKNSFNNPSYYAGGGLAKRFGTGDYYMDIGGLLGGITGYDKAVSPMAAGLLSVGKKDTAKLRAMYAPRTEKSPALLMMNLGIPFK